MGEVAAILKAERAELQARLDAKDAQLEQQRMAMEAKISALTAPAPEVVTPQQLGAFQARLQGLRSAELLSECELHTLEDLVADWIELKTSLGQQVIITEQLLSAPGNTFSVASRLHKIVCLSTAMEEDSTFARQVRRKFLNGTS